jgi:hypothetical protein
MLTCLACSLTGSLFVCLFIFAGSVIRDHGLIEIQPDTLAPSGDGLPTAAAAADAPSPAGGDGSLASSLLVNVNNRLVPEETPLSDGDYVVLSRDRVRI